MHLLLVAAVLILLYIVGLVGYRLYASPLAQVPGPKLAAATTLYNAYYDLIKGGQYVWQVEHMHRKYGPIVRTRPDTVHINDPHFVDKIYSSGPRQRRERAQSVLQMIDADSILSTKSHELHRQRRAVLSPYFSQRNVRRLEPVVNDVLANLLRRMSGWALDGQPVQLNRAFRAATKDVIQSYAFGGGQMCLDMEDCNASFFDVMTPQRVVHLGTHASWASTLLQNLPPAIILRLVPRVKVFADFMKGLLAQIEDVRAAKELPEAKTIFHEIMRSDVPDSEKATKRLADEAMVLLIAGSETTASTMAAIIYHVLADPTLLRQLRAELEQAMPDPSQLPIASKLDGLPLLNAIIEESLRLYPGATHRQDRVAPDEDIIYNRADGKRFVVPAGTAIGMTAPILNRCPDLYEHPDRFIPQRYIDNPSLSKHLFSFSKGMRQCIGINLAYQELQTFIAGIFRKYDVFDSASSEQSGPTLELYHTTQADIAMYADYVTPAQYSGSQGLRITIRE